MKDSKVGIKLLREAKKHTDVVCVAGDGGYDDKEFYRESEKISVIPIIRVRSNAKFGSNKIRNIMSVAN